MDDGTARETCQKLTMRWETETKNKYKQRKEYWIAVWYPSSYRAVNTGKSPNGCGENWRKKGNVALEKDNENSADEASK